MSTAGLGTREQKVAEEPYGPTGRGAVVLDIGGNIGALVLHTPPDWVGAEIEISPTDADTPRTHTAVRERRGGPQVQYAAVFAALPAGDYTLLTSTGHQPIQSPSPAATAPPCTGINPDPAPLE